MSVKSIVEAILFAANTPLSVTDLLKIFPDGERPEKDTIRRVLDEIAEDYKDRAVYLQVVASGYRFQVRAALSPWVTRLFEERPPRYSRALLETLAIIAYRQPVTRGDIEEIRGVAVSSNIIRTLLDREWVRLIAHKEVPGRPALYGTTRQFLDYFNLRSLNELPTLREIQSLGVPTEGSLQPEENEQSQIEEVSHS